MTSQLVVQEDLIQTQRLVNETIQFNSPAFESQLN